MTYDERHTRSRSPIQPKSPSSDAGTEPNSGPAAKPVGEQDEFITRVLGELTPRQRFVVECRHGWRDCRALTFDEIAALMGIRQQTVVEHYQAAIRRFRLNHAGTLSSPVSRGPDGQSSASSATGPMRAEYPVGGEEPGVCLSPFIPERYGVQPGSWPNGLLEWFLEQEAHSQDA